MDANSYKRSKLNDFYRGLLLLRQGFGGQADQHGWILESVVSQTRLCPAQDVGYQ
jgi:hypothetical protein